MPGESQVRPVASVLTGRRRNRWRKSVNEIEQTMVSRDSDELSFPEESPLFTKEPQYIPELGIRKRSMQTWK